MVIYELRDELIVEVRRLPGSDPASDLAEAARSEKLTQEDELRDRIMLTPKDGMKASVTLLPTSSSAFPRVWRRGIRALLVGPRARSAPGGMVGSGVPRCSSSPARSPTTPLEELRQGDPSVVNVATAGGDRTVYGQTAGKHNITRVTHRQHVAFGLGLHLRPGVPLTRREVLLAVETWLRRLLHSRSSSEGPVELASFIITGYATVSVESEATLASSSNSYRSAPRSTEASNSTSVSGVAMPRTIVWFRREIASGISASRLRYLRSAPTNASTQVIAVSAGLTP